MWPLEPPNVIIDVFKLVMLIFAQVYMESRLQKMCIRSGFHSQALYEEEGDKVKTVYPIL